jgi:hypothetical protein
MTADRTFEQLAAVFVESWAVGDDDQALEHANAAATLAPRGLTAEDHALGELCETCSAPSGVECVVRRGHARFHAKRLDAGNKRLRRDLGRAADRAPNIDPLTVFCDDCGAAPNDSCRTLGGPSEMGWHMRARRAPHARRVARAETEARS